ncbi:MAG: PIN domain-containing protein [Bacteroidales bacterium]|nr:PIN domain-containing protein [Bacteroidales bacterium]
MNVFIDTNILLDLLEQHRKGHDESVRLFQAIRTAGCHALISTQSIIDAAYIHTAKEKALVSEFRSLIGRLMTQVRIVSISQADIAAANVSAIKDYEDAAQVACALSEACDVFVTRDKGLGPVRGMEVMDVKDFLDRVLVP